MTLWMRLKVSKVFSALALALALALTAYGLLFQPVSAGEGEEYAAPAPNDPMQLARGAQAWADNCARCHNMRDPKELRDDQWRSVVAHMRVRGGLTGKESREILVFLQSGN